MRILASADVHGSRPVYDWLLNVAQQQEVDAIVLAGDLFGYLDGFDTPEDAQRHEATLLTDLLRGAGLLRSRQEQVLKLLRQGHRQQTRGAGRFAGVSR